MSHDYNTTDFRNLQHNYFNVEGAAIKDPVTGVHVQNEKVDPLPRIRIGLEPSELNIFLSKNVTEVVSDLDERENLIVGRAGPRVNHQTFKSYPDLNTHCHEPFVVWIDRPRRKPRAIIYWKHPDEILRVSVSVKTKIDLSLSEES